MTRYELHVPTQPNPGSSLSHDDFAYEIGKLRGRLVSEFGGCNEHVTTGHWGIHTEEIIRFTVDTYNGTHALEIMRGLARHLKAALEQEAVYLTRQPIDAELI